MTYDNSLKGFLDLGKPLAQATPAEGEEEDEDEYTEEKKPALSARPSKETVSSGAGRTRTPVRDRLSAKVELDRQLLEQKEKHKKDLDEARAVADAQLKSVLAQEEAKRLEKLAEIEERSRKLALEHAEMEESVRQHTGGGMGCCV